MSHTYKFKCLKCGGGTCEEIMHDARVVSTFTSVELMGGADPGTIPTSELDCTVDDYARPAIQDGDVVGYRCEKCDEPMTDPEGHPVQSSEGLAVWFHKYGVAHDPAPPPTKTVTVTVELVLRVPKETDTQSITVDWPPGYTIKIDEPESGKSHQALVEGYTTIDCEDNEHTSEP